MNSVIMQLVKLMSSKCGRILSKAKNDYKQLIQTASFCATYCQPLPNLQFPKHSKGNTSRESENDSTSHQRRGEQI